MVTLSKVAGLKCPTDLTEQNNNEELTPTLDHLKKSQVTIFLDRGENIWLLCRCIDLYTWRGGDGTDVSTRGAVWFRNPNKEKYSVSAV